jgi:hypothetical protein
MEDKPVESETIAPSDPVETFKKGRAKREAKRKEVKIISEYVPDPPEPATPLSEAIEVPAPPAPAVDAESIAGRVADLLFAKMVEEKDTVDKTPETSKTKARPKPPPKKKEDPPPTKYFGWC